MHRTYAVTWQDSQAPAHSGKLELRDTGLSLEGVNGSGPAELLVPYETLVGMRAALGHERLAGRPTLILDRYEGALRIASVAAPGIISEVAEELASLRADRTITAERVAIVVPIAEGKRKDVERLLDKGPPFDPEGAGLERHEVFLSDQEAVFVFDAGSGSSLESLLSDEELWVAAGAWHDCMAGPPRIATPSYAWASPSADVENLFFEATPGPGDSEGGDIYSP
jgi:hypothetical protein